MKQLVALAIVLGLFISGCAKRPVSSETSAPAPTGTVARTPEPAPRGAPTTPQVTTPGPQPGAPALQPPMPSPPRPAPAVPPSATAPQRPPSVTAPQPPPPVTAPQPPLSAQPATATRPPGPAPGEEFREVVELKDVHFDFDKYDIRPDAARVLDANVDWMKSHPDAMILVEGHCDERGTNDYNLALGDRRARATMNYLVARGVPATRIRTISYGEERPVCVARAEACWARNRRAHFLVRVR